MPAGESSNTRRKRSSATSSNAVDVTTARTSAAMRLRKSAAALRMTGSGRHWRRSLSGASAQARPGLSATRHNRLLRGRTRLLQPDPDRPRPRRHRLVPRGARRAVGAVLDRARGRHRARAHGGAARAAHRLRGERRGDAADHRGDRPRARQRPAHPGADRAAAGHAAPPRRRRARAGRRLLRAPARALRGDHRGARVDRVRRPRRLRGQLRQPHRLARAAARGRARRADHDRDPQRRRSPPSTASRRCSCTAGRWCRGRSAAGAARRPGRRGGAGPRLGALRPAGDHAGGGGRVRAAAERDVVGRCWRASPRGWRSRGRSRGPTTRRCSSGSR